MRWQFEQVLDGRGMMVFDHGWHQLAVASWLFGPIRRIFAWLGEHRDRARHRDGRAVDARSGSTTTACGRCSTSRSRSDMYFRSEPLHRRRAHRGHRHAAATCARNRISAQGVQEPSVLLYRDGETREFHDLDDRPPDAFRASTAHALDFYRGALSIPSWAATSRCTCSPRWWRRWSRTGSVTWSTWVRDTDAMAEEVGMTAFFPEVFQPGVPDIQPALRDAARTGARATAARAAR